jgi:hypothetical protein
MKKGRIQSTTSSGHKFSEAPQARIPRSSFDRSHGYKTTFDAGYLIPFLCDEALPGDTFNCKMDAFARLATPIFPIMDNLFVDTFYFAVPYRLVWDNWEKFNGAQENPDDSIDYTIPVMNSTAVTGYDNTSIYDYMGIPTKVPDLQHNSLHLRAYNLIWNEWFRDENLQDSVTVNKGDTTDPTSDYELLRRGKRHDYFTSALPWAQKGLAVDLPLGSSADIVTDNVAGTDLSIFSTDANDYTKMNATTPYLSRNNTTNPESNKMYADLTTATAATINQLRQAFQIQKQLERDARGGTRYIETIKSHFGVTSPDARLQRPEYLGGGSTPVVINPVAQTSETTSTTPQGNLASVGTASIRNNGFTKSFTEHNLIIGLMSVRADLTYQQGLNRMWSRQTRYDFYWPALSHIGEQSILNKEIYAQGSVAPTEDEATFGFQERYAEMRYKPSLITGKFRSNDAQSLDAWHLAQDFATLPVLDSTFIQETPPMDRIQAVNTEPDFLFDSYIKMRCARPMPLYGVPGLIDHF